MSILRTIAMFIYLFGYMILHYGILRRAERAAAAGDMATVEQIVNQHIPRWSRGILKVTGVSLSVEGLENIPKDRPACLWRTTAATTTFLCCWPGWKSPRHPCQEGWKDSLLTAG